MQRLEVSGAVRLIYGSLGVRGLRTLGAEFGGVALLPKAHNLSIIMVLYRFGQKREL